MPKYPLPTSSWLQLAVPELSTIRKRERDRIIKRIDGLLAQGIVPEAQHE